MKSEGGASALRGQVSQRLWRFPPCIWVPRRGSAFSSKAEPTAKTATNGARLPPRGASTRVAANPLICSVPLLDWCGNAIFGCKEPMGQQREIECLQCLHENSMRAVWAECDNSMIVMMMRSFARHQPTLLLQKDGSIPYTGPNAHRLYHTTLVKLMLRGATYGESNERRTWTKFATTSGNTGIVHASKTTHAHAQYNFLTTSPPNISDIIWSWRTRTTCSLQGRAHTRNEIEMIMV